MSDLSQLAASIAERGVRHVFGITGSGASLLLLDALEKHGVEPVRTFFEGSGALMAATAGRLSRRSGVAYCIKGPGLANMVPGMAAASLDAYPMVAITEAYPPGSTSDKAHKRLGHSLLTGAVCKGIRPLADGQSDFNAMADWAEAEVPGPVVLELTGVVLPANGPIPLSTASNGNPADILCLMKSAQRPVVIAGSFAFREGWGRHMEKLPFPVFSTAAAKGIFDECADNAAGIYTGVGLELTPERNILPRTDLVIGIGLRPNEVLATKGFHCPSVNVDPVAIPGVGSFAFQVVAPTFPEDFWEALAGKAWGLEELRTCRKNMDLAMLSGFLPGAAFHCLSETLGRQIRLVMDTGYFCTIGEHAWKAPDPDLCLFSGQGRYMGTSIPMAIGAAIYDPATPVVAVAGDGGIAMYLAEVRIAVERNLGVLFLLMSDGCFGSVSTRAIKDHLTRTPIDVKTPGWLPVMEGFGMPTWKADSPHALEAALRTWSKTSGPGYVEVSFPREAYEKMCTGIR